MSTMDALEVMQLFPQNEAVRLITDANIVLQILFENEYQNETVFNLRTLEDQCEPGSVIQRSFQLALVPAVIILLFFSFTQRRQSFFVEVWKGRPAFAYPMDIFTRRSRMSYSCAFGTTVYVVYKVVFERFYAFPIGSALYERPLATVASTLIYGTVYIPIFICITIGTVHGYGIGSLYMWAMTVLETFNLFSCDIDIGDRMILIVKRLPEIVCQLYLCIRLPWKFVTSCRERHFVVGSMELLETSDTFTSVKKTYYGKRVANLLKKPLKESEAEESSGIAKFISVFYKWEPDFQFSSRLITTQLVGAMLLYQVAFEVFAYAVSLFNMWLKSLRHRLHQVEEAHSVTPTNFTERMRNVLEVSVDGLSVFRILVYISFSLAFLLGILNILASVTGYRRYLKAVFQGDHSKFVKRGNPVPNQTRLAGCMRYAGFQVGYIAWGFIIQSFVFIIISFLLTILILVFMYIGADWLVDGLNLGWPVALVGLVVNFSQLLSARFLFLQDHGNTLALTNRRLFFIATYFMFFYNIFMGVFSCLVRVVESLIFGVYLLPRLDHCILPPSFRAIDPGYQAFIGFLLTESQHCHPVVLTFIHLADIQIRRRRGQAELHRAGLVKNGSNLDHIDDGQSSQIQLTHFDQSTDSELQSRKSSLAKFHWCLLFTLLNNPSVRVMRKGYMQAQDKAKALGLILPISDGIRTADVDLIREQTQTYLTQQEAEKEKARRRFCRPRGDKSEDDKDVALEIPEEDVAADEEEKKSSVIEVKENSSGSEDSADAKQERSELIKTDKNNDTNPIV